MFPMITGILVVSKGAFQVVYQDQNQLKRPLVYWLWLEKQDSAQKKIK